MLILPSRLSQNQFENNKSCEYSITTRYQYISVCIYHCLKGSFMNSLFIAYKNNEWCYFVVRISSPLIWFYCVCVVSFYFSFSFLFFFVESTTCWGIEVSLSALIIEERSCSSVPKWSFEEWVFSPLFSN